jgi:hypothetical protein
MTIPIRLDFDGTTVKLFIGEKQFDRWEGNKTMTVITPYTKSHVKVEVRWVEVNNIFVPVFDLKYKVAVLKNVMLDDKFSLEEDCIDSSHKETVSDADQLQ